MSHRVASLRTGERAALLAAEEACALVTALAVAPHDPTGVHEARKSLRRLRSLLALVRDALGKEAVDAIDDELRAMTRDLSAQIARETRSLALPMIGMVLTVLTIALGAVALA